MLPASGARVRAFLSSEPVGGALLLVATLVALVAANVPAAARYERLRDSTFGPSTLHLDLSAGEWAADGLLAIFFFTVGLELKRELVLGSLRDRRRALVPVAAAVGGVVAPALVYLAVTAGAEGAARGWAVPTATDIAFALTVLALVGRGLPGALRTFLLTLAVVDDLLAITIIAIGYTDGLVIGWLALAALPLALFTLAVRRGWTSGWLLLPVALVTWVLVHASGVHATVAGVVLGLVVPAAAAHAFEHAWRPWSTGIAVPVFAFFAAGVPIGGSAGLVQALGDPVALGIVAGLVAGKPLGVVLGAWAATRLLGARLDPALRWPDVAAVGLLAGVGFTVALLVGELAFGGGTLRDDHVKVGVLAASLLAAALGAVALRVRATTGPARPARPRAVAGRAAPRL
jgi:NhaA family Na+:H+ antiporter